jgi:hypothetical protein
MVETLKLYTEVGKLHKTSRRFIIEMCEFPIAIFNGLLSMLTFKKGSYENKWERDDIIERAEK